MHVFSRGSEPRHFWGNLVGSGSAQAESLQRVVLSAEMYERVGSARSAKLPRSHSGPPLGVLPAASKNFPDALYRGEGPAGLDLPSMPPRISPKRSYDNNNFHESVGPGHKSEPPVTCACASKLMGKFGLCRYFHRFCIWRQMLRKALYSRQASQRICASRPTPWWRSQPGAACNGPSGSRLRS